MSQGRTWSGHMRLRDGAEGDEEGNVTEVQSGLEAEETHDSQKPPVEVRGRRLLYFGDRQDFAAWAWDKRFGRMRATRDSELKLLAEKEELLPGLPDWLVMKHIFPRIWAGFRLIGSKDSTKQLEELNVLLKLRCIGPFWCFHATYSREWAAFKLAYYRICLDRLYWDEDFQKVEESFWRELRNSMVELPGDEYLSDPGLLGGFTAHDINWFTGFHEWEIPEDERNLRLQMERWLNNASDSSFSD